MTKKLKEYQEKQQLRWDYINNLQSVAKSHPNYNDYTVTVDSLYRTDYYESGTIISISPTREGFDKKLPKTYKGKKVLDATKHDLRFLDKKNTIAGLVALGRGRKDTSGFVVKA